MNLDQFQAWALAQGSVGKYNDGQFVGQLMYNSKYENYDHN